MFRSPFAGGVYGVWLNGGVNGKDLKTIFKSTS